MAQQPDRRRPRENDQQPRPRRRRRRRHMNPLLYMLLILATSALLASLAWTWAGDVLALNKTPHTAVVTVEKDHTLEDVTNQLKEEGLIEYKALFRIFCWMTHVEEKGKIKTGTYELNTDMDYNALINSMSSSGIRMTTTVTIPEGYTIDQIFALLEEKGVATLEDLQYVAANHDYKFDFLQGVLPLGDYHRLEGYLFPDTYEFYMGGGQSATVWVLNKMILRFSQLFNSDMRAKAEEMGYTLHEMVTIASLIEKETDGTDQTRIASVIYNRLDHPDYETAGYLQIDAAIAYATGRAVTQADYQNVDSPYNTYLYKGLPPGPIANPGMVALNSAINPESTSYYYYVLGKDGVHHYFKTHQGQLDFIANDN